MDYYGYVAGIAAAVLTGEMLLMLIPSGGMRKFARFSVGMLISLMLVTPLKGCDSEMIFEVPESDAGIHASKTYEDFILDVYQSELGHMNE